MEYTKAPWKAGKSKGTGLWHIHGGISGGEYIGCLPTTGRCEANANLIASAPDMQHELETTTLALESMLENTVIRADYIPFLKTRIKANRKALAKATGKGG